MLPRQKPKKTYSSKSRLYFRKSLSDQTKSKTQSNLTLDHQRTGTRRVPLADITNLVANASTNRESTHETHADTIIKPQSIKEEPLAAETVGTDENQAHDAFAVAASSIQEPAILNLNGTVPIHTPSEYLSDDSTDLSIEISRQSHVELSSPTAPTHDERVKHDDFGCDNFTLQISPVKIDFIINPSPVALKKPRRLKLESSRGKRVRFQNIVWIRNEDDQDWQKKMSDEGGWTEDDFK